MLNNAIPPAMRRGYQITEREVSEVSEVSGSIPNKGHGLL